MAGTRSSRITGNYGTASDENGNNFEEPKDATDILGVDPEIGGRRGSAPRRPPMGGTDLGKGLDLERPRAPRSGIGIEIGKSAAGNLGIGVEIPLPVPAPISGRGGVSIDPATGKIRGGYGGLGIGKGPIGGSIDVGVDTPLGSDKIGCFKYVTFSLGPFSHTYGKNECEPKTPIPIPIPTPTPVSGLPLGFPIDLIPPTTDDPPPNFPVGCLVWGQSIRTAIGGWDGYQVTGEPFTEKLPTPENLPLAKRLVTADQRSAKGYDAFITYGYGNYGVYYSVPNPMPKEINLISYSEARDIYYPNNRSQINTSFKTFILVRVGNSWVLHTTIAYTIESDCPPLYSSPSPSFTPIPNPPPKKKMDADCCKIMTTLLLMQHKHLGVTPIAGMESLYQFAGVSQKGEVFKGEQMAFPFEVPKVWLDPTAKRNEKITVKNLSELLFIMGSQSERLENILGTKEFLKDSQQQLRQSEIGTLKWLSQRVTGIQGDDFTYPDPNDFWFNTDDGIINEKKVEVRSIADGLRYLVESQNRLERILPVAEIKDSSIPARWVYPGKKGQLRVGNLIHLVEYMFRADDRARGYWPQTVTVKDANPSVKGDQKIELKFQSQADMLREMFKFIIDTEGDGDVTNNFALRSAMQQCQIHQLSVQNNAMLDAIVEYLDFKIERKKTKVPMPFSPFGGHSPNLFDKLLEKLGFGQKVIPKNIDKNTEEAIEALFEGILQNTEVEVPIIEANEKKTLNEALIELLKHSSAASAAVSERVGEGALKRLVDSAGVAQAISRFLLKRDIAESNGIGDLDKWINSAEAGYTDNLESESLRFPESNPLEPYNRPTAQNPLIREIDTKDPKAD